MRYSAVFKDHHRRPNRPPLPQRRPLHRRRASRRRFILPPAMPKNLPPVLKLLTSKVPEPYKACVAEGVFPALAAHLHDVKFRYIDNTEREATLMALLIAPMSTGKSSVNVPINKVMADIEDSDKISRERDDEIANAYVKTKQQAA